MARRSASLARSEEELAEVARELGPRAVALASDVGDRAQVEAAVERFVAETGGLDLVIANAGIAHYGPLLAQDVEKVEQMTRVNWLGTVYTVKAALGHLSTAPRATSSSSPRAPRCARSRGPRATAPPRPPSARSPRPCGTS